MQRQSHVLSIDPWDFELPGYLLDVSVQPRDLHPAYADANPADFNTQYYQDDRQITAAALPLHPLLGTAAVGAVYRLLNPFETSVRDYKDGTVLTELGTSTDPAIHLLIQGRARLVVMRSVAGHEHRWVVGQYGIGQWIGLPQLLRESDRTDREGAHWPDGVSLEVEALGDVRTQRIALDAALGLLGNCLDFRRFVEHHVAVRFARRGEMLRRMTENPLLRLLGPMGREHLLQLGAIVLVPNGGEEPYIPAGPPAGRVALLLHGEGSLLIPNPGDGAGGVRYGATFRRGDLMGHEGLVMDAEWRDPNASAVTIVEPPRTTAVRLAPNSQVLQFYWYALRWALDDRAPVWMRVKRILSGAPAALAQRMPTIVSFHGARHGLGTTVLASGTAAALASVDANVVKVVDVLGAKKFDEQWKDRSFNVDDRKVALEDGPRKLRAPDRNTDLAYQVLVPPAAAKWPARLEIVWPTDTQPESTENLIDALEMMDGVSHIIVLGHERKTGELMGQVADRLNGRCNTVFYLCDDPDTVYPRAEPEHLTWVYRMTPAYLASEQRHAGRVRFDWLFAGALDATPSPVQRAIETIIGYNPNEELARESLLGSRRAVRVPDDPAGAKIVDHGDLTTLVGESAQDVPLARAFARMARVVDRRTVGLALGGGGAWGFAHVALLRNLEAQHVPIDYIAGTSFGSVVGGLYAAGGMRALDLLVNQNSATGRGVGPTLYAIATGNLNRALFLAPLSTFAVEAFVNATLRAAGATCAGNPPCLGTTEIPFYPVGTNLGTHEPLALPHAAAGWGVRMSGSLPPMYASLVRRNDRVADGAFIANVPSRLLRDLGAHFVIAANVVPPPPAPVQSLGMSLVTWLPRKILERLDDSVRGLFVLAWKAGEDQGALAADLALDLRPMAANLFEMWRGRDIVEDIELKHFTGRNAGRIYEAWSAIPVRSPASALSLRGAIPLRSPAPRAL